MPVLAQLNRAGMVTDFSQPGGHGDRWSQRAAVSGFCSDDTNERLRLAIGPTDLVHLAEIHGGHSTVQIPVTLGDGKPFTWIVGSYGDDYLLTCYGGVPFEGLEVLRNSWFVTVFDPTWGRNDRLWPALRAALGLP